MKKLFHKMNIQQSIFACIILFSLIPQLILLTLFYRSNVDRLVQTTQDSIYHQVRTNSEWLDEQLYLVKEATKNILVDSFLYNVFSGEEIVLEGYMDNDSTVQTTSRNISKTLYKYFGSIQIVSRVEIATRDSCIAMDARATNYDQFWDSDVCDRIVQSMGGIVWLKRDEMLPFEVNESNLSCARLMNLRRVTGYGFSSFLPKEAERPVLRVTLSDEFIAVQLERSVEGIPGAQYGLLGEDGSILFDGDSIQEYLTEESLQQMIAQETGTMEVVTDNHGRTIVCFDRLDQPGWISMAAFSVDTLAAPLENQQKGMYIGVVLVQILTLLITALMVTGMLRQRIQQLSVAVNEVRNGNFATRISDERRDEFTSLVEDFNEMSGRLRQLIDENLQISMQAQEARLQTLMTQLNPHYIYNSLNVINWVALRENAYKTSALMVSLSRMLRYTSNNQEAMTRLGDDIAWMRDYFKMMDARFAGLYTVKWEIREEDEELLLPKLFLQPLVENSILHGFSDRTEGGLITIRLWCEGEDVFCEVTDNGCGMDMAQAEALLSGRAGRIGLSNVHRRIRQCYGPEYGITIDSEPGQGTRVCAHLRRSKDNPTDH